MKYTLHKLEEGFIITSDEDIREGDNYICISSMYVKKCIKKDNNKTCFWVEDYLGNNDQLKFSFKVIAQQDQINFSALSEEEQKKIGWFDVNKIAREEHKFNHKTIHEISFVLGVEVGFQKAQELLSDRMFTLEEVKEVWKAGQEYWKTSGISREQRTVIWNQLLPILNYDLSVLGRTK